MTDSKKNRETAPSDKWYAPGKTGAQKIHKTDRGTKAETVAQPCSGRSKLDNEQNVDCPKNK